VVVLVVVAAVIITPTTNTANTICQIWTLCLILIKFRWRAYWTDMDITGQKWNFNKFQDQCVPWEASSFSAGQEIAHLSRWHSDLKYLLSNVLHIWGSLQIVHFSTVLINFNLS
jgi:hypothetical protein